MRQRSGFLRFAASAPAVLMAALCALALPACDDDDDDEGGGVSGDAAEAPGDLVDALSGNLGNGNFKLTLVPGCIKTQENGEEVFYKFYFKQDWLEFEDKVQVRRSGSKIDFTLPGGGALTPTEWKATSMVEARTGKESEDDVSEEEEPESGYEYSFGWKPFTLCGATFQPAKVRDWPVDADVLLPKDNLGGYLEGDNEEGFDEADVYCVLTLADLQKVIDVTNRGATVASLTSSLTKLKVKEGPICKIYEYGDEGEEIRNATKIENILSSLPDDTEVWVELDIYQDEDEEYDDEDY